MPPACRSARGENLITARDYRRYFEARAMDVCMVDVPWNGFGPAKRVADMAETFEINCAPHNYYSHLSTLHSVHLCAVIPNVRICEIDIDDVPWKDDLITEKLEFDQGDVLIPDRPGMGRRPERGSRPRPCLGKGAATGYLNRAGNSNARARAMNQEPPPSEER